MDDKRLWAYVIAVVVAVVLIVIAVAMRKRDWSASYGISPHTTGMLMQGSFIGFLFFLVIIGFMTYGAYHMDVELENLPFYQNVFRAIWAVQLVLLILLAFAYRCTGIAQIIAFFFFLLNLGLLFYVGFLTQNGTTVPMWCYLPFFVLSLILLAGAVGARATPELKAIAHAI